MTLILLLVAVLAASLEGVCDHACLNFAPSHSVAQLDLLEEDHCDLCPFCTGAVVPLGDEDRTVDFGLVNFRQEPEYSRTHSGSRIRTFRPPRA
jgi:hypothetical protein